MKNLTAEWLTKAEEDFSVAIGLVRRRRLPANSICFHCQPAAEKYLKALLQHNRTRFGRTHDLEELLRLISDQTPGLMLMSDDLKLLSDYSVRYRYPGIDATPRQARNAVTAVKRVRQAVLGVLPGKRKC
ncbi:MAG: HEPN domain-containing protein [Planctomycetota bacterium]|nr:HEPN domain-containing protein [Planctomycetota bacterium]